MHDMLEGFHVKNLYPKTGLLAEIGHPGITPRFGPHSSVFGAFFIRPFCFYLVNPCSRFSFSCKKPSGTTTSSPRGGARCLTLICFAGLIGLIGDSSRQRKIMRQVSHPPLLNTAASYSYYSCCCRLKRVGLVMSCVLCPRQLRGLKQAASSSSTLLLLCLGVKQGCFLRVHLTLLTISEATGPATAKRQQRRVSTTRVAAALSG